MALSWNEIKERAIKFSKDWENAESEKADAQPFLIEFFNVFGITRRKVATFENKVQKLDERDGYIDLIWKGVLVIEMKSRGENLDKAYKQAKDYMPGLKDYELPRYIIVCDFEKIRLYDIDENSQKEFTLKELVNNVQFFDFIAGYKKKVFKEEDPVNIKAAEKMGKLHDALKEAGYKGHELEVLLVRLLFCLFAEDTGIFEKQAFQDYIETKTKDDGTDLGLYLQQIFDVLNTPESERQNTLDELLTAFPYVNGQLFSENLHLASFNSKMRLILLECCHIDWRDISPAIFGSMFQSVMNPVERRNLGAHYTSEKNILKLIKPLFLDKLWVEFEKNKNNEQKLKEFHTKIASLRFLDPACGCGNFLVITYREIRILELAILKKLYNKQQLVTNLELLVQCDVDRFYGIEYEEFPAQIAQVALWLIDHQMNMIISQEFGEYFVRLPLRKSAKIVHGNALRMEWDSIIESLPSETETCIKKFNYILGNPPFLGKKEQNKEQRNDKNIVFKDVTGAGVLDYVTAWYIKASQYLVKYNTDGSEGEKETKESKVAFVSTNSITQGEQVGILWNELFTRYKIKIHFAHRTFRWSNEAKGKAAVHVVIIGFSNFDVSEKFIYEYENINAEPLELNVINISPYLIEGSDFALPKRNQPISNVPQLVFGNMANDGGFLILNNEDELNAYLVNEPEGKKFIRPFVGSEELINNFLRYCFWLKDISPSAIKKLPLLLERINKVKNHRLKSSRIATKKLAKLPYLFGEIRQNDNPILVIPRVSSEKRKYIPLAFLNSTYIVNDRCTFINDATLFHFGVLSSLMHMTWTKLVCGRMKSDYNYSNSIVYNNFPWAENPTQKKKDAVKKYAQEVIDVRLQFSDNSLADLYDPLTMPPALVKAHQKLDKAVDLCYRPQPFKNESGRIKFLFELYDTYTSGLFAKKKTKRERKKSSLKQN